MNNKRDCYRNIAIDRLVLFISKKQKSFRQFEIFVGLSNGYISKQLARKGAVGSNVLEKIITHYPELDIMWLLTGNNKMIMHDAPATTKLNKLRRNILRRSA